MVVVINGFRIVESSASLSVDVAQDLLALSLLCVSGDQILHVLVRVWSDLLQRVLGGRTRVVVSLEDLLTIIFEVRGNLV